MQNKIYELLSEEQFDAVHCEFPITGEYDFGKGMIRVLDTHNVEYKNFKRMSDKTRSPFRKWFYRHESEKVRKEEIAVLRKQDVIFTTSKADRAVFRKDLQDVPIHVIPNGVDTTYFRPSPWYKRDPHAMVFTGSMGYVPNNDGMLYFLDEVFPRIQAQIPQAKIFVVGNRPSEELKRRASDQVVVTGFVEDVRPFVWRSSLFVVPLRMGSGTRLKVVEALAMKKPVVSTSLGCEGIDVEDGENILIEDQPQAFADAAVRLMRDEELQHKLAHNGFELIKDNYDWTVIGDKLLEVYESLEKVQPSQVAVVG
jgi:glycosyltransferase involved in cell wall biosynthesis